MTITYHTNRRISTEAFIDLLERSSLAERRPIDDLEAIDSMLEHANLTVTAWDGPHLVGIARSLTDFTYACYLSDLAVDSAYQRSGIGIELQRLTQAALGPNCKIILLAAPNAASYYPRIGYAQHESCWILPGTESLGGAGRESQSQ